MADERYRKDYPHYNRPEEPQNQQHQQPSHLTRPAGTESHGTSDTSRTTMATSVTLPSIHDHRSSSYGHPPQHPHRGYAGDPRYGSPSSMNGYPPPGGQQQQQAGAPPAGYLPPLQSQPDPRASPYPPPEQRGGGYYDDRRGPPQYADQYPPDAYYYRGPPQGPPHGYPRDYRGPPPGPYPAEYGPPPGANGPPAMAQAAPRQRTSIACRYCRKRKIRCSGYQSAPGGKCQNCARMNQDCVFQPVSSSSSTAFIPVSAVPGGVPPGTQLFGAYGQPLPSGPSGHQYSHNAGPPPPHGQPPVGYYQQPMQSPTESFSSFGDPRGDDGSQSAGRRRRRTPEEHEEGYRLPPPRSAGAPEEEPRRRSPGELSSHSSPGGIGYPPYPARHSPRSSILAQPTMPGSHASSVPGGRSPVTQTGSSGASTPARPGHAPPTSQPQQQASTSVMSLSNLVDKNEMDKTMISRLNRQRDSGGGRN